MIQHVFSLYCKLVYFLINLMFLKNVIYLLFVKSMWSTSNDGFGFPTDLKEMDICSSRLLKGFKKDDLLRSCSLTVREVPIMGLSLSLKVIAKPLKAEVGIRKRENSHEMLTVCFIHIPTSASAWGTLGSCEREPVQEHTRRGNQKMKTRGALSCWGHEKIDISQWEAEPTF